MDNRYLSCPPLMQDGRFLTNYVSHRIFEQSVRNINGIGSAQEYRRFLQLNASEIMNRERDYALNTNTCKDRIGGACVPINTPIVNKPECGCACR